jgi:hypothetical protein
MMTGAIGDRVDGTTGYAANAASIDEARGGPPAYVRSSG